MSEITINASQFITDLNKTMGTLLQTVSKIEADLSSTGESIKQIREKVDDISMYVNTQIAKAHENFDDKLNKLAARLKSDIEKIEKDIEPFLVNKKIRQKVFSWANSGWGTKILAAITTASMLGFAGVLGFELKNSASPSQTHQLEVQQKHIDALMKANESLQDLLKSKK